MKTKAPNTSTSVGCTSLALHFQLHAHKPKFTFLKQISDLEQGRTLKKYEKKFIKACRVVVSCSGRNGKTLDPVLGFVDCQRPGGGGTERNC